MPPRERKKGARDSSSNEQCHASDHPSCHNRCLAIVIFYRFPLTVSSSISLLSFLFSLYPPSSVAFSSIIPFVPPSISADSLNYLIARTKETRALMDYPAIHSNESNVPPGILYPSDENRRYPACVGKSLGFQF